jgi:lipopolysaccharide/colanic/teichoic acid biosynthesis glycosyltransferase
MRPRRRKVEAVIAGAALLLLSPLFAAIAIAIYLSDPGSVFYMADRAGLHGTRFRMFKFRTMYRHSFGARIAAPGDTRIFPLGRLLRRLRLDELPQLINIVRGEMAFVGPRPEDPWIVDHVYSAADRETLNVLPGLTSPGTLYYCMHAEQSLNGDDAEAAYMAGPLRRKLEFDRTHMSEASATSDFSLVVRTLWLLATVVTLRAGPKPRGSAEAPAHQS